MYPTVTCTAVPDFAGQVLMQDPPCVLLYVRGVGENHDAQNILLPLVIDNVLLATNLLPNDVFALPVVIQASAKVKKNKLTVLVEENVLAVMYNPFTVPIDKRNKALQLLGLADSSISACVSLRGIPVEYIADPDVILTNPVPTLDRINMIMIPLEPSASGLTLMQLLIGSGAIDPTTLLHFTVLPANQQARQEFRHQRLYVFLTLNAFFKDAMAFSHPSVKELLLNEKTSHKRLFKSDFLPGILSAMSSSGSWSRNRQLLSGSPQITSHNGGRKFTNPSPHPIPSLGASPEVMSEPSCVTSISSVLHPDDLTADFGAQVTLFNRQMFSQQQLMAQQTSQLLENSAKMVLALEALTLFITKQTPSPGTNGDIHK
jgi:hypothetical protein